MTKEVVILGGVGNGSVIAAAMLDAYRRGMSELHPVGYLNDRVESGDLIEGLPCLGGIAELPASLRAGRRVINTIYRIDGQRDRLNLFDELALGDDALATFVHPTAYVAPDVDIAPGCVVMPNASVSPGVVMGRCNLIMVNATIGHNTKIARHCHFAAQSCVSSFVTINEGVHIGLNATVREGLTVGAGSTVAMGAVQVEDLPPNEIWAGVPARFLRNARPD